MDNNNGSRSNRSSATSTSSDDGNSVSLRTLLKHFELNKAQYNHDELSTLVQFFKEEEVYVHNLEILEVQRDELKLLQIPDHDLANIFGCTREITEIHKYYLPTYAIDCRNIEEVLQCFFLNQGKLRCYIRDSFMKSQTKLLGRKAIERRFYSKDIVINLGLPKKRIANYMKFCQTLKVIPHLEDSMIVHKCLEMFKHIYLQIEFALQLAAIRDLSQYVCVNCDVLYIDKFQIAVDHGQPSTYKVHCLDKAIIITSTIPNSINQMQTIDYYIDNTKIQYVPQGPIQDDLTFEFTEYVDTKEKKNKKRVYTFTAENSKIKSDWTDAIQNILYKQLIDEKYKVKTP